MSHIIKVTDTSIDVTKIMAEISAKAMKISKKELQKDIELVSALESSVDISPNIIQYIQRPKSKKSGWISKVFNKIIEKIYFVMWNSLGNALARQQEINSSALRRIEALEGQVKSLMCRVDVGLEKKLDYFRLKNAVGSTDSSESWEFCIKLIDEGAYVLEVGCKTGEFLETIRSKVKSVILEGVESNADMVSVCRNKGLNVLRLDPLDFLEKTTNSYDVIVANYLLERLSYSQTIDFLSNSYSRLKKGGKLIIVGLNPGSLSVYVNYMYRDPHNKHLIHPDSVGFLAQEIGFGEVNVALVHPQQHQRLLITENMSEIEKKNLEMISDSIYGPRNYVVVAYK